MLAQQAGQLEGLQWTSPHLGRLRQDAQRRRAPARTPPHVVDVPRSARGVALHQRPMGRAQVQAMLGFGQQMRAAAVAIDGQALGQLGVALLRLAQRIGTFGQQRVRQGLHGRAVLQRFARLAQGALAGQCQFGGLAGA